ncbi:MAG TPA: restriction endonuclease [Streptosporangiaceae bacterium]
MARKKSLWSELQRERERRERAARAQERENEQTVRQIMRDHERAERQAAREDAAERKRQEQLAHEAGAAAAKAMKTRLDARVSELRALLTSALAAPPELSFDLLKRTAAIPAFELGDLGRPVPAPVWEDFTPPPPGVLSGLIGGKARQARAQEAARDAFEHALADHALAEDSRVRRLFQAREAHDLQVKSIEAEVREHNAAVDAFEARFQAGSPEAVEEFFDQLLALSEYPSGFPHEYQVAYRHEPRELVIEYRLPPVEVVPTARDFRYVKTRKEIDELPRPAREVKDLYASVIHQVALRTMWECFSIGVAEDIVDSVVFNGIVPATNRATGQAEELHLISAPASRTDFSGLVLDQLDPAACLKHLKAIVSPHPYDLEPVEPVIEFQQAKYRFANPVDALAGLDSRPDLLKMDWYKFENLIRQLFEAMGLDVQVTQSSRDEGIDAVAYNKTDIVHRSEILIQAKRYSKCVPTNDLRALAGSVEEKRAHHGMLVTTAWVSPESKAFAARNNRLTIIEGGELKHLLAEHLNLNVRIDLARRPRRSS